MKQEIQFCITDDKVKIAYAKIGVGLPLVKTANFLSHLEYDWSSPVWKHWLDGLSQCFTLYRYDERGCGLSDWNVDNMSFEAWLQDLETIVDANKLERFTLFGMSQGGPIAIAYAARYPEKVSKLILYGTYVRGIRNRGLSPKKYEEMETLIQLIKVGWGQENPAFRQVFTTLFLPEGNPEQINWFNELQRISTSPENAIRMIRGFDSIDVCEMAASLNVPTLVLHSKEDARVPYGEGQLTAELIPDAKFIALNSKNHILLSHEPAWKHFMDEVRKFTGVVIEEPITSPVKKKLNELNVTNTQESEKIASMTQTLEKFVPKQFLKRIATEGLESIEIGKSKIETITILFSDIRSYTTHSERMTPQELLSFLNTYLKRMSLPIHEHDGFIDKFIGDAIMALFDAPDKTVNEQAEDGVRAAIDMQKAMYIYNQSRKNSGYLPINTGVGVHTGEVIIGTVGSDKRMDSTVLGDSVNIAARLESITKVYGAKIIISSQTRRLINDESILFREVDHIVVKGKEKAVRVFEVINGDDKEVQDKKRALIHFFHEGLQNFYSCNWDDSIHLFNQCLTIYPDDAVSQMYIKRCNSFKEEPPPNNWDGVFRMTQK